MSEAEMKVTGVWQVLEKNKTKKVTKDNLLKVMKEPKNSVTSKSISVEKERRVADATINWLENFQVEEFDPDTWPPITRNVPNSAESYTFERVAGSVDSDDPKSLGIIRITDNHGTVKYGYTIRHPEMEETLLGEELSDSLEDMKHIAQARFLDDADEHGLTARNADTPDWRRVTIEEKLNHLDKGILAENYQERIVIVPDLRRGVTKPLKYGIRSADSSVKSHLGRGIVHYKNTSAADIDINIENSAVHYRTTDYDINGGKYLLIQEIQSDFFQKLRQEYGSDVGNKAYKKFREKTPFSGTDDWIALAFRHALDAVIEKGDYKGIAWLDGKLSSELEGGHLDLFQDKILTKAIARQMKRNGLDPKIIHDKKLGFHIMDIDEESQLLIKDRGQPTYAKAVPPKGFDFKPLEPSKAPDSLVEPDKDRFYSGLKRVIENQRESDIRNGTQWRKYLIAEGMSEAEMKVTGVWSKLESSNTKVIKKETLLALMKDSPLQERAIFLNTDAVGRIPIVWKDAATSDTWKLGKEELEDIKKMHKADSYHVVSSGEGRLGAGTRIQINIVRLERVNKPDGFINSITGIREGTVEGQVSAAS